jgi:protein-S-isoprenylcysteine O-methyltransferase Ste14
MTLLMKPHRRRAGWRWVISTSVVGTLWMFFLGANLKEWAPTHRPVGLGVMELELAIGILFVIRRQPVTVSRSRLAWLAPGVALTGMLLARPAYGPVAGLDALYTLLQLVGAAAALLSLVALGRSFGLVAANRGLKTRGPYALVRHPVYAAYLVTMSGYVLENPSPRNLALVAIVLAAQVVRIGQEEKCLSGDPSYREYRNRVRYRLVPYIY